MVHWNLKPGSRNKPPASCWSSCNSIIFASFCLAWWSFTERFRVSIYVWGLGASLWLISLLKRTGVEKENEGAKCNLCLLRTGFVDGQAKPKVFLFLVRFCERRKETNGPPWKRECFLLERSLVISVSESVWQGVPRHRGKSEERGHFFSPINLPLFGGSD